MRTDFESTQSFEVSGPDGSYNETEVIIGLECIAPYSPGCFHPTWGGEPPFGPEFEVTTISVAVPKVNYKGDIEGYEPSLTLSYRQFSALVGREICDKLVDMAMYDATEEGDF